MKKAVFSILIFTSSICFGQEYIDSVLLKRSFSLANQIFIIDTHIDLPDWLYDEWFDVSNESNTGEFDYVRAKNGGLDLAFLSIFTPAKLEGSGKSKLKADSLITLVENLQKHWPEKFQIIKSTSDIEKFRETSKILLAMGMENGSPIEEKLDNLKEFYDRGIRYITLAHGKSNHISDSSYDEDKKWNGLSPFGEQVVKEMNRLGIMIDVSHLSDSAFYDVIRLSKAPVIASHSCCRFFTPGYERNMSDEMIKLLAEKNGVIQISFAGFFLRDDINKKSIEGDKHISEMLKDLNIDPSSDSAYVYSSNYWKEHPLEKANVKDVADHIDHVVKIAGIDFVGLGSDFNGVGNELPIRLRDVSEYPNLIYELLSRGYSEDDLKKICGQNLLRVWAESERISNELNK
ncbi:MAG: membrane dipeptidase [Ignavibacteriaceae bacterium]|nr:membrane dipeptidase [Ignavibacteriaceae bacterium]